MDGGGGKKSMEILTATRDNKMKRRYGNGRAAENTEKEILENL